MTDAKKLNIHGKLDWVFYLNMDAIEKKACGPGVPKAHGGHSHNRYLTMQFRLVYTVQSIPSVYIRPPPPLLGHLSSCRPRHWEFVRRPLPWGGAFAILLGAINIVPFPIFHLKHASLDSYRYFFDEYF